MRADPFGDRQGGTTVTCMLHLPGQYIVGVVRTEAKLDSFTDDKGTNLRDPGSGVQRRPRFGDMEYSSAVTSDGEYCTIPRNGTEALPYSAGGL